MSVAVVVVVAFALTVRIGRCKTDVDNEEASRDGDELMMDLLSGLNRKLKTLLRFQL